MKLLGWMQHKLRPSKTETFKDFTIGNCCAYLSAHSPLNDLDDSHQKSTCGYGYESRFSMQSLQESENSFTEFEGKGIEDNFGDETSAVITGLFHGFLTIGTLGSEQITSEPVTPTFTVSVENVNEKTEVTENDLKLINDELEKFLEAEAEAEEHGSSESSRRNSQVSTITLSGKPLQEANNQENGKTIVCPLQGYLFGSSIELPETKFEVKKEKASLAELFSRTKIAEESPIMENCVKEEMLQTKRKNKPVKHIIKKILRKLHASNSTSSSKETSSVPTKKKLQKVIKLFHRKVHPESSIAERESKHLNMNKVTRAPYNDDDYTDGDQIHQDKDNRWFPKRSRSKAARGKHDYETISKLPQSGLTGCTAASVYGEHWIKTDADYLVLEL